jgi:hypothetical protein
MGKNNGSSRLNHKKMRRGKKGQFVGKRVDTVQTTLDKFSYQPFVSYQPMKLEPLGTLTLRFFGADVMVTGGPYLAKPEGLLGVKMAKEINADCDVDIPTQDFQTPDRGQMIEGMLTALLGHFALDERIYVGCMAGKGRTGLFMATLAYLSGEDDPVAFVRQRYYAHAVETPAQERYVKSFDRKVFRRMLMELLVTYQVVTFTMLARMTWQERLLWLKAHYGRSIESVVA